MFRIDIYFLEVKKMKKVEEHPETYFCCVFLTVAETLLFLPEEGIYNVGDLMQGSFLNEN